MTGGLETLVLEMCHRMRKLDSVQVQVCAIEPGDELEERPRYAEVQRTVFGRSGHLGRVASISALVKLFRRERPDVAHLHNFLPHVRGSLAARLAAVPVVVTTKHGSSRPRLLHSKAVACWSWQLSDVVVAVSADAREKFVAGYGFPVEKARVILNGVDTDRFLPADNGREAKRSRVLGVSGRPLLGTVCRIESYKGIPTLLEALTTVVRQEPETRLVVVGDGSQRGDCERRAQQLGLADRVYFLGNRADVDAIYPLLDLYVQPSYSEGISLTLLEACSCELPVVATTIGGNPEIVVDRKTGILVPPRDADALSAAILEQWHAPDSAHAMGRAARARVVEMFSLDSMIGRYVELYQELLSRRGSRGTAR